MNTSLKMMPPLACPTQLSCNGLLMTLATDSPTSQDLKSPNILVDERWRVKIADFGLSRARQRTFITASAQVGICATCAADSKLPHGVWGFCIHACTHPTPAVHAKRHALPLTFLLTAHLPSFNAHLQSCREALQNGWHQRCCAAKTWQSQQMFTAMGEGDCCNSTPAAAHVAASAASPSCHGFELAAQL
jgi:hypothetical protein